MGKMTSASLAFGSTGVNPSSSALATLPLHNLLFHASGPTVCVLDTTPTTPIVTAILPTRPTARVAAVAACASGDIVLVCAALSDGALATFVRRDGAWAAAPPVEATGGGARRATPLVAVSALAREGGGFYCVTAAMDDARGAGLCVLWDVDEAGSVASVAKTEGTSGELLPECVEVTAVGAKLVVALGGTDRYVHLFERGGKRLVVLGAVLSGHRDWVRGLKFSKAIDGEGSFLLATASTDATVRVWTFRRVEKEKIREGIGGGLELSEVVEDSHRANVPLVIGGDVWIATLDALLMEHDKPVLSVDFAESGAGEDITEPPALLTASMDGSVAVWKAKHVIVPHQGGQHKMTEWCAAARFGLLGGSETAALGFSSAVFVNPGIRSVLAHTLNGSVHFWRREPLSLRTSSMDAAVDDLRFLAESAPGGHVAPVTSLAWEPRGEFLMSCSEDKTTRIYVPFPKGSSRFVEWSRPQVHGHPVRDIAFMTEEGRSFASVSDEKVIRLFDAPSQFELPGLDGALGGTKAVPNPFVSEAMSASIPELGLSNKPVYAAESEENGNNMSVDQNEQLNGLVNSFGDDMMMSSFGAEKAANTSPLEIELRQDRLWPERAKLYGHGNDAFCISVDLKHGILASASRAQANRDAFIVLWDIGSGMEKQRLFAHDLTVNQLHFSSDGGALLSVSRDRSFSVFSCEFPTDAAQESASGRPLFKLATRQEESHGRLLHTGCWMFGQRVIATGSRDRHLKLWRYETDTVAEVHARKFGSGVSALHARSIREDRTELLAIGLEDGGINVYKVLLNGNDFVYASSIFSLSAVEQCCGRVSKLVWRPSSSDSESNGTQVSTEQHHLAVASADCSVRVLHVLI